MPGEGVGVLKFEESDGEDDGGSGGRARLPKLRPDCSSANRMRK